MNDVAVVVGSCDAYHHAWPLFCHGLKKYWPNPLWPVYIVTNHLDAPCGQTLKIGNDPGWSRMVRRALRTVNKLVVLWMVEDAWLTAPPNTQNLMDWVEIILGGEADYIRLCEGFDHGETFPDDPRLFVVSARYQYRASLVPALWRTSKFMELLGRHRESPWTFEREGSKRAWSNDGRFLAAKDSLTWRWPHITDPDWQDYQGTPISKGRWTRLAKEYVRREGITIDWKSNPHGWK